MKIRTYAVTVGLMATVSTAQAANPPATVTMVPPVINYQGRLMTPANSPYADKAHKIDLTLYPLASGGPKLWSENYTVMTRDGYFSVNLGSGGTGLLPNNLPLWQVLWNFAGNETNEMYMALTVRTDQNGNDLASPLESTPRQQFLTTPFALRSHQSVYARKADSLFEAPQGVQAPSISTTNAQLTLNAGTEVALNRDLRVPVARTIYANRVRPTDGATVMTLGGEGTQLITIGEYVDSSHPGTDLRLYGKEITLAATNLSIVNDLGARKPMFVRKAITVSANTTSSLTLVNSDVHDIDTYTYELCVVGWYYSALTPSLRAVYASTATGSVYVYFNGTPTGGSLTLHLLAYPKSMTGNW